MSAHLDASLCWGCYIFCREKVEKNKERLKLEQGDDKVKDSQIARLIELEREVSRPNRR